MRWRDNTRATELEEIFARHKRVALLSEPLQARALPDWEFNTGQQGGRAKGEFERPRVINGRSYATRGWIVANIFTDWSPCALSFYLHAHKNIRRVAISKTLSVYDLADLIGDIVAGKTHSRAKILPNVSRVLQGSRSINEALLAFVQESAECRGNER